MRRSHAPSGGGLKTAAQSGPASLKDGISTARPPVLKRRLLAIPSASECVHSNGGTAPSRQTKENDATQASSENGSESTQYFTVLYTKKVPNKVLTHAGRIKRLIVCIEELHAHCFSFLGQTE